MTIFASDTADRPRWAGVTAWTVTSPHGVRDGGDATWRPFGRRHALPPGSRLTACGRDAHTWRRFGHLDFEADHPEACASCTDRANER